ncbi:hypothetical protein Trydic_g19209 [Trypoxylus dichotomus]
MEEEEDEEKNKNNSRREDGRKAVTLVSIEDDIQSLAVKLAPLGSYAAERSASAVVIAAATIGRNTPEENPAHAGQQQRYAPPPANSSGPGTRRDEKEIRGEGEEVAITWKFGNAVAQDRNSHSK